MSAITIAGDTSGSITLNAPAVAGSTTLTLPATSGTVFVGGQALSATTGSFSGSLTLGSSVLATPSGSAPSFTCRAWVNFNGEGTVAIRASGNVSSITDNGTGNYTINFTTAMPDASYVVTDSLSGGGSVVSDTMGGAYLYSTSSFTVNTRQGNNTQADRSTVACAVFR